MKRISDLKTTTLERKYKETNKKIEQSHENAKYEKLDALNLQLNRIEVELEARNIGV